MNTPLLRKLQVFAMTASIFAVVTSHANTYKWANPTAANTTTAPQTGSCTGADFAKGTAIDGRGNSYVVGTFTGTATFGPTAHTFTSAGGADIFIEKYDNTGAYQWSYQAGGTGLDDARSVAVYPDGTGGVNIYVTGFFTGSATFNGFSGSTASVSTTSGNSADQDMYIVKYADDGTVVWAMRCGNATHSSPRTLTSAYDIAVNNNGAGISIWVCGSFMGTVSFVTSTGLTSGSASNQNGFLACYTDGGSAPTGAAWAVAMKDLGTCQVLGVDADKNGVSYVTGYWLSSNAANFGGSFTSVTANGGDNGWVARYSSAGVISNVAIFGSTSAGVAGTSGQGIAVAQDGSVYVVGAFTSINTSTPTSFPYSTSLTSLGGGTTGIDGFVMNMTNATTGVNWLVRIGGSSGDDYASRVAVDNCGKRCYVTGNFSGTESFNGASVTLSSSGASDYDAYLCDLDASTGAAISATRAGGTTNNEFGVDVAVNAVEDVVYCGNYKSATCSATPSFPTNLTSASAGTEDGFIARWDDSNWPALETTGLATNQGVSTVDCSDYAVGDMTGVNVQFGATTITSSQTNSGSAYTSDIYLINCDKYASYSNFVRLTSGTSAETCKDLVSSSSYHYVAGSATTGANQNGVTFVGDATDSYTNSAGSSNAIVIKTDLSGAVQWARNIQPAASGAATGESVAYDASGNVYFCGWFSNSPTVSGFGTITSAGGNDIFVIKYNASGAVQWVKTFGGTSDEKAFAISIDPTGSYYYITGATTSNSLTLAHTHTLSGTSDGFVMRGDVGGTGAAINDVFWSTASVTSKGTDVYSNGTTEVYVTGIKTATTAVYVASYDLSGTTAPSAATWSNNSSGGGAASTDIILGGNGYVYVSGIVNSATVSFGSISLSVGGFVVGFASWNGSQTWGNVYSDAKVCGGIASDLGDIANDHGFVALICGSTSSGSHAFIHKVTQEGCEFSSRHANPFLVQDNATTVEGNASIYPNPFNNEATLKLAPSIDPTSSPVSLMIFDMAGRVVNRVDEITSMETTISAGDLVDGVYFYQVVQNGNVVGTGKMMISK